MDSFEHYLKVSEWKPLNDYYRNISNKLDINLDRAVELNSKNRRITRKGLEDSFQIKKQDPALQKSLKDDLFNGDVVGVDGTCSSYDFVSGMQAIIGIVSVNYINEKATYTTYISEPYIESFKEDFSEQMKYLKSKGSGKLGLTDSLVRAIMLWKEREFVLERKEKFKMVQGDIMPYELRYGQGKLRGLDVCLNLMDKLLGEDNIVAVQSSTSRPDLRWCGTALEQGEYFQVYDYDKELEAFLYGDEATGKSPAHFSNDDRKSFEMFIDRIKGKYAVGLYKLKNRAYVFHAPKVTFDRMANLIFADSQYQPLRGFPLLLDFADMMCSKLVSRADVDSILSSKMARRNTLEYEINERNLRRR